jgi:hypothetical protein
MRRATAPAGTAELLRDCHIVSIKLASTMKDQLLFIDRLARAWRNIAVHDARHRLENSNIRIRQRRVV